MTRHTPESISLLLILVVILAVSVKGCYTATHETAPVLSEGYPTREVIDTKKFDRLVFGDSLALVVASAYYVAFPNELGLCIYGSYSPGGTIVVVGLRADSAHTEEGQVRIFCEEEDDPPVIGSIHSHPGAANPAYPCTPSPQDYATLLTSDRGVMVIYCGNGSGVTVFRGGRQWNFAWR